MCLFLCVPPSCGLALSTVISLEFPAICTQSTFLTDLHLLVNVRVCQCSEVWIEVSRLWIEPVSSLEGHSRPGLYGQRRCPLICCCCCVIPFYCDIWVWPGTGLPSEVSFLNSLLWMKSDFWLAATPNRVWQLADVCLCACMHMFVCGQIYV